MTFNTIISLVVQSENSNIINFLGFLSELTGVKRDTIYTVLTTLFVFGFGVVVSWSTNIYKEHLLRKNYRKTINLLLTNLSEVCKKQHKFTFGDLESFSLLDNKLMGLKQQVNAPLTFLNKMDYSHFIKYYVRGCNKRQKIKATTKVFQIIGFLTVIERDYEEKLNFFLDHIKPMQVKYVDNMLSLEAVQRELPTMTMTDYSFKQRLGEIFKEWDIKHTNNNFRNSFANLVSPLIRLSEQYQLEPTSIALSKLTRECHVAYNEIAHIDEQIREYLKDFSYHNKKIYRQLNAILNIFK